MSSAAVPDKPFIREAVEADVGELAETMRLCDRAEVLHSSLSSPLQALLGGYLASRQCFAIEWQGRVVALFGVVGIKGSSGCPWMLGTDDLRRCWSLLRECRERIDGYLEEYHFLTNAVWAKNTVHIKWIKWLGFTFEGSDVRNGQTFLHFHRRKHV